MYFLLFLLVLVIVYINSFKDNFDKENIAKVTPILFAVTFAIVILSIVSALL